MKVGILSDVHGNGVALDSVIEDMKEQGVKEVFYLGDLVAKGPEPARVFKKLESLEPSCWIKGNTDTWFEEITEEWEPSSSREEYLYELYKYMNKLLSEDTISFLINLPIESSMEINGVNILCVHGSPRSIIEIMDNSSSEDELKEMVEGVEEDIIVCGHSHVPYMGEINEKKIINVGSVGCPYDGDKRASYAILNVTEGQVEGEIRRVEYEVEKLLDIAQEKDFPFQDRYAESIRNAVKD